MDRVKSESERTLRPGWWGGGAPLIPHGTKEGLTGPHGRDVGFQGQEEEKGHVKQENPHMGHGAVQSSV